MLVQTAQFMEQTRRADPESWRAIESLLHHMPRWVQDADRLGEVPESFWTHAPIDVLNRMHLPCEYGGTALTCTALRRAVLFEYIARICPALLIAFPGPGLSLPPVLSLGTEKQKHDYSRRFLREGAPVWGAFAITEPQSGSDATALRTLAVAKGEGYEISGQKCFITNGKRADVVVVFATIAPQKGRFGIRAFVVDSHCPGFRVERCEDMMGLRASQLASLSFNDCFVPRENMLGHTGQRGPLIDAFTGAQSAWDYMRPILAAIINGACLGIVEHAASTLREGALALTRSSSGHALSELARLRARIQSAQMLTLRAAWKYDAGQRVSLDASMTKAYSSTLAMEVASVLNRLMALHSVSSGDPIEKFYRDAKAFDILEGTGDMQRLMIARAFASTLH